MKYKGASEPESAWKEGSKIAYSPKQKEFFHTAADDLDPAQDYVAKFEVVDDLTNQTLVEVDPTTPMRMEVSATKQKSVLTANLHATGEPADKHSPKSVQVCTQP